MLVQVGVVLLELLGVLRELVLYGKAVGCHDGVVLDALNVGCAEKADVQGVARQIIQLVRPQIAVADPGGHRVVALEHVADAERVDAHALQKTCHPRDLLDALMVMVALKHGFRLVREGTVPDVVQQRKGLDVSCVIPRDAMDAAQPLCQ